MCNCKEAQSIRAAVIAAHGRGEHRVPDPGCPVCQAMLAELRKTDAQ